MGSICQVECGVPTLVLLELALVHKIYHNAMLTTAGLMSISMVHKPSTRYPEVFLVGAGFTRN